MKKKIVVILITIILCLSVTLYSFAAVSDLENEKNQTQNSKVQIEEEYEEVTAQKNEELAKIDELSAQITESEKKLEELNSKIKELETSIKQAEQEIAVAEKKYNEQQEILEKRMVAQYKTGKTSYLDVLLNSSSLSNFISNYYLVGKIAKADNQLLEDINAEKEKIEKQKAILEQQRVSIKTAKAEAEKENVKLKNAKAQKNSQVAKLSEQQQSLQEQIETYNSHMSSLEAQIRAEQLANSGNGSTGSVYNGIMLWPVPSSYKITSTYGMRIHPIYGIPKMHNGIDVGGAAWGDPFVAADDGVVIKASDSGDGYGKCVVIDHGGGVSTLYGHGSSILVEKGQTVKRGDKVLGIGSSGISTGKHAHFEVRVNGAPVNPLPYIT